MNLKLIIISPLELIKCFFFTLFISTDTQFLRKTLDGPVTFDVVTAQADFFFCQSLLSD